MASHSPLEPGFKSPIAKPPSVSEGWALPSVVSLRCVLLATASPTSGNSLPHQSYLCGQKAMGGPLKLLLTADIRYCFFTFYKAYCLHTADPECPVISLRIYNVPPEDAQGQRKQTFGLDAIQVLCLRTSLFSPWWGMTRMVISCPKLKELS